MCVCDIDYQKNHVRESAHRNHVFAHWVCTADIDYLPKDNLALAALRRHALLWADALTRLLLHRHSLPLVAHQMV